MRTFLSLLLASIFTIATATAETFTFIIKTLPAQMRYDTTELTVTPGSEVKIAFENPDDMPHNLLFFQPGTDVVAVCNAQLEKPEEALKRDWIPTDPRLLAHTPLVNPKGRAELAFRAPDAAGVYPFVCSMPGHAAIMQGRMRVSGAAPKLQDLKFAMYLGAWKTLPDFPTLKPFREGELKDGLVEIKLDDYRNDFGVVYSAKVNAETAGDYTFAITGDDGVRLSIDGKKLVEHDGIHPAADIRAGKVKLAAGTHDFRLEYFQAAGEAEIFAAWSGPTFAMTPLSKWTPPNWKEGAQAKRKDPNSGMPLTVEKEPVIYRNFIVGAGDRGIAVGYPGGFNIAWNAETMALALVWRGAFIDAARHWTDRGGGAQPPLGYDVLNAGGESGLPLAVVADGSEWPRLAKGERATDFKWRGYTLDHGRFPTFSYDWNGVKVSDRFDVAGNGTTDSGKLTRTVKLDGAVPAGALFRLAAGAAQPTGDGAWIVENGTKMRVSADGAKLAGKSLVVPARSEIVVTYSWPTGAR